MTRLSSTIRFVRRRHGFTIGKILTLTVALLVSHLAATPLSAQNSWIAKDHRDAAGADEWPLGFDGWEFGLFDWNWQSGTAGDASSSAGGGSASPFLSMPIIWANPTNTTAGSDTSGHAFTAVGGPYNWVTTANWTGGVPSNSSADQLIFGNGATASYAATINTTYSTFTGHTPWTVNSMTFNNPSGANPAAIVGTINSFNASASSAGGLVLAGASPQIAQFSTGSVNIYAPIQLNPASGGVTFTGSTATGASAPAPLTLAQPIGEAVVGTTLNVTGGNFALTNVNSFSGGTVISGGTVSVQNLNPSLGAGNTSSLGTGAVTLAGGTLRLHGAPYSIGARIGVASGVAPINGEAGVVPMLNWTTLTGTYSNSLIPFTGTVTDNTGATVSGVSINFGGSGNTSVYTNKSSPTPNTPDAAIWSEQANGNGTGATSAAPTIVVNNLPAIYTAGSGYSVYVYYGATNSNRLGYVTYTPSALTTVTTATTTASAIFSVVGLTGEANNTWGGYLQGTLYSANNTTASGQNASVSNFAVFNQNNPLGSPTPLTSSSFSIQTNSPDASSNILAGIEVVSNSSFVPVSLPNAVNVTANSAIDVTGAVSASIVAPLTITSTSTPTVLSVTGGGSGSGSNFALTASGTTTLAGGNGTFNVANNSNGSGTGTLRIAGLLSDGGSGFGFTKTGAGTLVLANSTGNTYGTATVGTTISGGVVQAANTSGSATSIGPVNVGSGGTLAGANVAGQGFISGDVTVAGNGAIAGVNGSSLTLGGALTLSGGSSSSFLLSGAPNTAGPAMIAVGGSLAVNGAHMVNLVLGSGFQSGTYDLFSYSGSPAWAASSSAFNAAFQLGTQPIGYSYSLVNNTSGSQVDVVAQAAPLSWTGANGSLWNTSTANWANTGSTPATAASYADGFPVSFGDLNPLNGQKVTNSTIVISATAGSVSPLSTTFTNTGTAAGGVDYTFAGQPLAGSGPITMSGTGDVAFASANTFTGPVSIVAGRITAAASGALGNSSGVSVAAGAALELQGGVSIGAVPLSISGTGLAANPGGALNSVSGTNAYAGSIAVQASGTTIGSSSTTMGDGLTLTGGIDTGGNSLSFVGAGNTTVSSGAITGTGSIIQAGSGTLTLSAASTFGGGTTVASGAVALNGSTVGAAGSIVSGPAGTGTIRLGSTAPGSTAPASLWIGAPGGSGGRTIANSIVAQDTTSGALTIAGQNTSGTNILSGNLTLGASADTGASVTLRAAAGGQLNLSGNILANGADLTAGINIAAGGTVRLTGQNTYAGGTTVNSGATLAAGTSTSALGAGPVNLAGGRLQLQSQLSAIGVNYSGGQLIGGIQEVENVTGTAGIVPIGNWNNIQAAPQTNPVGSFANIHDSVNAATTIGGTYSGPNTFSTFGAPQANQDAQLENALLNLNTGSGSISVSGVPYSSYVVYLYFGSSAVGRNYTLTFAPNGGSPTNFFLSTSGVWTSYIQNTNTTNSSTFMASNYAVTPVQSASSFTINATFDGGTAGNLGIFGFEIVSGSGAFGQATFNNNVNVTADSTIDVTGPSTATVGNLSIGGNTLSVTGGSTGANQPYSLVLGNVTLSGNAAFNVSNNGAGAGTLSLAAVSDGNAGYGITLAGNGTLSLANPAGNSYGGTTAVNSGTLRVAYSTGSATGSGAVNVAAAGTLAGPTAAGGQATIAGPVTVAGTLAVANGATLNLNGGLTLQNGSSQFTLAGAPGGAAMIATSGGSGGSSVAIDGTHTINFAGTPQIGATYELLSYTGAPSWAASSSSFSSAIQLGTQPGPVFYQLVNDTAGSQVDVTTAALVLTWSGAGSPGTNWDSSTANWTNNAAAASAYVDGAAVVFGDTDGLGNPVANTNITIVPASVSPLSVTFNNSGAAAGGVDYTVTGAIAGSGPLAKNGAGLLTLSGNSTYSGGTAISNGAILLASGTTVAGNAVSKGPVGVGTVVIGDAASGSTNSAALSFAATASGLTVANPIVVQDNTTPGANTTIAIGGLNGPSTVNTFSGSITLGQTANIGKSVVLAAPAGGEVDFTGTIRANGGDATAGVIVPSASTGTIRLTGNNTYAGGTTVAGGTLAVTASGALGGGPVTLSGGRLQLAGVATAGGIGIHFATDQNGTHQDVTGTAGVVPMSNWNNIHATTFGTNGSPSGSGLALNDNTGSATGATLSYSVTGSTGGGTWSVYGAAGSTPDAQLNNAYLDVYSGDNANLTVTGVPYSQYSVYAYFNADGSGRQGSVTLGSTTYDFSTEGAIAQSPYAYTLTSDTAGVYPTANYAVFTGVAGTSFNLQQFFGTDNSGVTALEIVNTAAVTFAAANNVSLTADSTIDVTGPAAAGLGNLSIGGNTLSVTGGSSGANQPYALTLGTVTLSGNAIFNVANNGSGIGSLLLGAIGDATTGHGITKCGPGTLVLTAGGSYSGSTVVNGGTLRVTNAGGTATGSGPVTVGDGVNPAILAGSTVAGQGAITGPVTINSAATLAAASGATLSLGSGLTLMDGSLSNFALTAAGANNSAPLVGIIGSLVGPTSGSHTIYLTGTAAQGAYDLYSFTGSGPTGGISLGNNLGGGFNYSLRFAANQLDLIVSVTGSVAWNTPGDSAFGTAAAWDPTQVPNTAGLTAVFAGGTSNPINNMKVTSGTVNVLIDGSYTVGGLTFDNATVAYTLANDFVPGDGLTLDTGIGSGASVTVNTGSHTIAVNLTLADNAGTTFNLASGTSLAVSGVIAGSGANQSLTLTGGGTLTLSNTNSYSGGTTVNSGTLRTTAVSGALGTGPLAVNSVGTATPLVDVGGTESVGGLTGSASGSGSATVKVEAGHSLTVAPASGSSTFAGTLNLVAGNMAPGGTLSKSGGGTEILTGAVQLNNNSILNVSGGTLRVNASGGTIGTGVTANVSGTGTLELAGSYSALGTTTAANRTAISNSSMATVGVLVSSGNQQVGAIDGSGNVQVTPPTGHSDSLTADHITAGSLVIGGDSSSSAVVTIAASNPDGTPMAQSSGFALAGSLAPSASFASGALSSSSLLADDGSTVNISSLGGSSLGSLDLGSNVAAVPEPSTIVLLVLGSLAILLFVAQRRASRSQALPGLRKIISIGWESFILVLFL